MLGNLDTSIDFEKGRRSDRMESKTISGSVKGLVFKNFKTWLLDEFGQHGFRKFLSYLSPSERELWDCQKLSVVAWYPAEVYINLYNAIIALWGEKDSAVFRKGAAFVAYQDLSSIMKALMRLGTPSFVASRFPIAWRHYFSAGLVHITASDECSLTMEILDADVYGVAGCEGVIGWTSMALEYSGAKKLVVEHNHCRFKRKSSCIIQYQWDC
jgi:hypothetical protein